MRVSSTTRRSNVERLMTLSTSAVAACCSRASSSSRRSRTTSVCWSEADVLLWRTAFGAFALRLCALVGLLLALERRRIAHPKGLGLRRFSKRYYSRDLRLAKWGQGSGCTAAILNRPCPLWVKSRPRGTSNQCPLYPQKRTSLRVIGMSALCQKRTLRLSRDIGFSAKTDAANRDTQQSSRLDC